MIPVEFGYLTTLAFTSVMPPAPRKSELNQRVKSPIERQIKMARFHVRARNEVLVSAGAIARGGLCSRLDLMLVVLWLVRNTGVSASIRRA
jgi:hypothetical protein